MKEYSGQQRRHSERRCGATRSKKEKATTGIGEDVATLLQETTGITSCYSPAARLRGTAMESATSGSRNQLSQKLRPSLNFATSTTAKLRPTTAVPFLLQGP